MRDLMSEGNETGVFDAYGTTEFPGPLQSKFLVCD